VNVFVDTSGIVALLWARDTHHRDAAATWKALVAKRARFVTTDLILAEAVALTRARAGYELSVQARDRLTGPPFDLVYADEDLVREAFRLYRKYSDHELSLCDCVSFAVMRARRMTHAFAYDSDFEAVGFVRCAEG